MNTNPNPTSDPALESHEPPPAVLEAMRETRPFYWSVRRELWENRSVYLAPLLVAAVVLFGSFIATLSASSRVRAASGPDAAKPQKAVSMPIGMAPAPIMLAAFLVGVFYSIDALYGERRDRSILFWKSLPVSDRTVVLSKAAVPILVLPFFAFVLSNIVQIILLPVTIAVVLGNGGKVAGLWAGLSEPLVQIYGLSVHLLWFAPIYAWLLLISAWARRAPLLWALLPVLALGILERILFNTHTFVTLMQYRLVGAMREAFEVQGDQNVIRLYELAPLRFLSTPGLWLGLLFAAACLATTIRLRRGREPI